MVQRQAMMALQYIYRPISLPTNFSKMFERVIQIKLVEYLEENSLVPQNQYGFRKDHNTEFFTRYYLWF